MIAGIGFKSTVTITSFNELFESYIKRYSAFTVATSKEKATNAVFLKFVNTNHLKLIQIEEAAINNIITPTFSHLTVKFLAFFISIIISVRPYDCYYNYIITLDPRSTL